MIRHSIVRPPVAAGDQRATTIAVMRGITATTIALSGIFEAPEKRAFNRAVADAMQTRAGIVVDLRACATCDSSVLVLLVQYKRAFGERMQIVVSESGTLRRILETAGLTRRLGVTTSLDFAHELLPKIL